MRASYKYVWLGPRLSFSCEKYCGSKGGQGAIIPQSTRCAAQSSKCVRRTIVRVCLHRTLMGCGFSSGLPSLHALLSIRYVPTKFVVNCYSKFHSF